MFCIVLYEIKIENQKKDFFFFFFFQIGNFLSGIGKKTYFLSDWEWGQNRVIESPVNNHP